VIKVTDNSFFIDYNSLENLFQGFNMNKINLSLILIPLFSSALMADELDTLDMTDYKLTDTFFDEAYVNGQFSLTSPADDTKDTSYNGHVNSYYRLRNMTLDYAQDFRIDGNYDIVKSDDKDVSSEDSYDVLATGHADKYLLDVDQNFLLYGSGTLGYRKTLGADTADDPFVQAGVGVGYGRIYDATPYAKAIRILKDLKERKIVSANAGKETALKLADLISKESEYVSKYSAREYRKYWFNDMSKLLKSTGATEKELDSFGIIRIEEILVDENIFARYHGWIARAGVGQILSNYNNEDEDPTLDLEFEYGKPIGLKSQFFEQAKYSTILNGDIGHTFNNTMTYSYEMSDRIDWENKWLFSYVKPTDDNLEDITTNTLTSSFSYYIANSLSLDTTLSFSQIDDGIDNNGNDDVETKLFVGATYRLK
jgi:hypothetical protein